MGKRKRARAKRGKGAKRGAETTERGGVKAGAQEELEELEIEPLEEETLSPLHDILEEEGDDEEVAEIDVAGRGSAEGRGAFPETAIEEPEEPVDSPDVMILEAPAAEEEGEEPERVEDGEPALTPPPDAAPPSVPHRGSKTGTEAMEGEKGEKGVKDGYGGSRGRGMLPGEEALSRMRGVIEELDIFRSGMGEDRGGKEEEGDSEAAPPGLSGIRERRRRKRVEEEVEHFVRNSIRSPLLLRILRIVVETGPCGIPRDEIEDEIVDLPERIRGGLEELRDNGVIRMEEGVVFLNNAPENLFPVMNLLNMWHNPRKRKEILQWMEGG